MEYYAHSLKDHPPKEWQPLEEHLHNVAEKAAEFAKPFGGEEWARLAGLWHDVGKGTRQWQAWLRHVNKIVDKFASYYNGHPTHANSGAQLLSKHSSEAGKLLAYCIAGHHGGLPNWDEASTDSGLKVRLNKEVSELEVSFQAKFPIIPPFSCDSSRFGFQLQFFTRMLFSCLVDADYLDTELFIDNKKSDWRNTYPGLYELSERFAEHFNVLRQKADPLLTINRQRETVLQDCLKAAEMEQGLFSLTVPTGGGKTLASLAFALKHAEKNRQQRIIYVIPFTSIIEQNGAVFRKMLGDDAILEHHCNFIPEQSDWITRLASENWDAPIVVSTNVQFFNSFYSNKPSKARKLHNVANSIVIFDEVQAIPVEKLKPCLEVIKELTTNYGVTAVLCTATQPAIEYAEEFQSGLKNVQEIVSDVDGLFASLKRTQESFVGSLSADDVAERLAEEEQVLCIVNTRQQALDVFEMLPENDANIHLSALMHPNHRTQTLTEIRERLDAGLSCRVVSTQLIEAGVDVDFPCVYRAVSGIDSIAQAAGRCNRNGRHATLCPVYVFKFPEESPYGAFRQASQSATKLFDRFEGNLTDPACVQEYFADYLWKNEQQMDDHDTIRQCMEGQSGEIQFKDIAEFQMIKTATIPIIISLEPHAQELVRSLAFTEHPGGILRQLQQYTVQIYPYQVDELRNWLTCPLPGVFVLESENIYTKQTGLKCNPPRGEAFFG